MRAFSFLPLLLCAAIAAAAPGAGAEPLPRVAVLPFEPGKLTASDAAALTLFAETALQNTGRCVIVEQSQVDKILKAHQYALADFNDPAKAVEIGKLVPADHIVLGTAGILAGKYFLNLKLVDLRTGTNEAARAATAASLEALAEAVGGLAAALVGGSPPRSAPPAAGASPGFVPGPAPGVAPSAPGLSPPQAAMPVILGAGMGFFESGAGIPPLGSRTYSYAFPRGSARFINWEITIDVAPPSGPLSFPLSIVYRRPDGGVHASWEKEARLDRGSAWVKLWDGWGSAAPGTWAAGAYRVEAYSGGTLLAWAVFELY